MPNKNYIPTDSVLRHMIADYIDVAPIGSPMPDWAMMGDGFTSINENPNPQNDTAAFVNNKNATITTVGFQSTFPYSTRLFVEEEATMKILDIVENRKMGREAMAHYVRVNCFHNPFDENLEQYGENEFKARRFLVSVVGTIDADGAQPVVVSGDLNVKGDFVLGKFNIVTREFTPITGQAAGYQAAGLAAVPGSGIEDAHVPAPPAGNSKKEAKANEKD